MNRSIYHSYFRLLEKLKLSVQPWLKQAKFMLLVLKIWMLWHLEPMYNYDIWQLQNQGIGCIHMFKFFTIIMANLFVFHRIVPILNCHSTFQILFQLFRFCFLFIIYLENRDDFCIIYCNVKYRCDTQIQTCTSEDPRAYDVRALWV